jgi:5'-methylthioadenosine phosphorylase
MIAIIGGSGLYEIEGLQATRWQKVSTPFGEPSDKLLVGKFSGRDVVFLPRHARGHRILPSELNHRANIWALKSLGVRFIISVSAVGSLQQKYRPLDIVFPNQFLDRTKKSLEHTFFGQGIVAHVALADPICSELQKMIHQAAKKVLGSKSKSSKAPMAYLHGTYVNMEGPAFSTRAESKIYRKLGADIIGMTNLGEAKLAREAEIAYTTMAMVTDYDCWKTDEDHVTVEMIIERLHQNAAMAKEIIRNVLPQIPLDAHWSCHEALKNSIITDKKLWPAATIQKLRPILKNYL